MNLLQFYYTNRGIYSSIPLILVSAIRTVTRRDFHPLVTAHPFFKPAKPSNMWPVAMDFPAFPRVHNFTVIGVDKYFHNFCKADIFSFNKIFLERPGGYP